MAYMYLEDANVHRGILFADALIEQCRAEGDERCGADAVQELAEVEEPAVPRQRRRELFRAFCTFIAICPVEVAYLVTKYETFYCIVV